MMRVFIAVATSSEQHVKSMKSCFELVKRDGDAIFMPDQFGPGLTTRVALEQAFFERPEYDATLLLDGDQYHPKDMLEKLREPMEKQGLDMVTAVVYRRSLSPIEPLMCEIGDDTYPYRMMYDVPTEGLHEIAQTGFGAVLIHRRVIEAVRKIIPDGDSPFAVGPIPGMAKDFGMFGQDFRFFTLARSLGFKLWLRADVESLHGVTMWLGRRMANKIMDYQIWADKAHKIFIEERLRLHGVNPEAFFQRKRILEARKLDMQQRYNNCPETDKDQLAQLSANLWIMTGKILEVEAWIEWAEKYPAIERPDQLPTTQNSPKQVDFVEENQQMRQELYRNEADEMVKELPNVADH